MKNKLLPAALIIIATVCAAAAQSLVLNNKMTTYTRKKPIADHKKTFTINYPIVKAATPALTKKIQAAISYSSVLGLNLKEELGPVQWLEEADYDVIYNTDGVFSIDLEMNGSGAYPSGITRSVVIDIRTGTRATAANTFVNLPALTAMIKQSLRDEIDAAIVEIKRDPENGELDTAELFKNADLKRKDLEGFSAEENGVIFKYDYGFPHVIQALQPEGRFFFTWEQLKPYIARRGLLSRIAR
jgi:hypothetical protein